tara:strand:+ start:7284 stop:7433 length:150 start_codon:yes stop_codon:yes gene_type:complete
MGEEVKTISQQVNDEEWEVIHMYWDKAYEQYYVRIMNTRTEEEKWGYVI